MSNLLLDRDGEPVRRLGTYDYDPTGTSGLKVGDTYTGTDGEGHRRVYTVRSFYGDGTPQSWGWNAPHADDCPCSNPEEWY